LLAGLLISISFRIIKSLIYFILNVDTHVILITLGHAGLMATGPFMLLYLQSVTHKKFTFCIKHLLHFIPFVLILSVNSWLIRVEFSYVTRHAVMLTQMLAYIITSLVFLFRTQRELSHEMQAIMRKTYVWLFFLVGTFSIVWIFYSLHHLFNIESALMAPVLYAMLFYVMVYLYFNHPSSNGIKKSKPILSDRESKQLFNEINTVIKSDELFTDPALSLPILSSYLDRKPHQVSYCINKESTLNFSVFINKFRIEHAKNLLNSHLVYKFKISGIAYDCGFNSYSAFNASFKRISGTSPSAYLRDLKSG